jgi:hypothetical protein
MPSNVYEVRPRKDKRGVDLISDALPLESNALKPRPGFIGLR